MWPVITINPSRVCATTMQPEPIPSELPWTGSESPAGIAELHLFWMKAWFRATRWDNQPMTAGPACPAALNSCGRRPDSPRSVVMADAKVPYAKAVVLVDAPMTSFRCRVLQSLAAPSQSSVARTLPTENVAWKPDMTGRP